MLFNSNSNIDSPLKLLKRFQKSNSELNSKFLISVYDKFGNSFTGTFQSLNLSSNVLIIDEKNTSKIYFDVSHIAHIILHNSIEHESFLNSSQPSKQEQTSTSLDVDEYVDLISDMLLKNYSLSYEFFLDEVNAKNKIEADNLAVVLDSIAENIKAYSSEKFSLDAIKKINKFEILNADIPQLKVKLNEDVVSIKFNFEEKLPRNLSGIIESGLSKLL